MGAPARRVVFVVGSGRSGTSTMSGALQTLGMHVPQPEVVADETNPKGFGEPRWVVDFHDELLKRCNVQVSDARPIAWSQAAELSEREPLQRRLREWLEEQFAVGGPELVVKDPRLAWFLDLWCSVAVDCGATPAYVTMLRPVTEVVGSKQKYYSRQVGMGDVQRTVAWLNIMLGTEVATRGSARRFVRYHDLLTDWTVPVSALGRAFDLASVQSAGEDAVRRVHDFIDPSLHRVQLTWDDVTVPDRLRTLAQETWRCLDRLADEDGDAAPVHAELDGLRAAYADLYAEAEAVATSSAVAARREGVRAGRKRRAGGGAGGPGGVRTAGPSPAGG